jgi:glycosidase
MARAKDRIRERLFFLYGERTGEKTAVKLLSLLEMRAPGLPSGKKQLTHEDVVLITYPDGIRAGGEKPLQTLGRFLDRYGKNLVSIVHILPFFPSSSDDGFSVIDYRKVDPEFGTWGHITRLAKRFSLMFDLVMNHVSSRSRAFREFLGGSRYYRDWFITVGPDTDTSRVFRPRALPLITVFKTPGGDLPLWTTFSADQIDLNFKDPAVLLSMIDVLLLYVKKGASLIRLDAIAYLWKKSGTSCIHLPQTHAAVKLLRDVLERYAPHVKIVTETNVPHEENISYFGNGSDEAHMVYNFALPPLSVYAILAGNAAPLTAWAATLRLPGPDTAMYNFIASHDGIGILPARGLLTGEQIALLLAETEKRGGRVSSKQNPDGSTSPYELNISLFDLLSDPAREEPLTRKVDRFIACHAVALSLKGVPALYYHSLLGSQNDREGVARTGMNRAINREKLDYLSLVRDLESPENIRSLVYRRFARLIEVRRAQVAFHPSGDQTVMSLHPAVFACERSFPGSRRSVLSLVNVSGKPVRLTREGGWGTDLLTGETFEKTLTLHPYGVLWIQRSPRS